MNKLQITEIKAFVPRPEQLRKARDLLQWSVTTAAQKSHLTESQVSHLESDPRGDVGVIALEDVYRGAGISFAMFSGLSGQIYKTRLYEGDWSHVTIRGPHHFNVKG